MAKDAKRTDGKVFDLIMNDWVTPELPKPALAIKVGDTVRLAGIGRGHDANTLPFYVGRVREIYQIAGQAYLRAAVDVPEWAIPLTVPLQICELVQVQAEPVLFYRWIPGVSGAVGAVVRNGRTLYGPLAV